ncbi:homeobox protein cut-like isoform X3 [Scylla paramamosain]|uniref:homeobox protein cut-like isoform X3 n=1 Tax=Scylla paramamosain TaxID=85552 RepID=UPI0030836308
MPSPIPPLAGHPQPGTPLHHLFGDEWRRSLERTAQERHHLNSAGQMSPDSGGGPVERSDSRDSPLGDVNMKSPSSLVNGFPHETKSPFQPRDDRSPFKEEISPLAFKFEDRITGESLIPKGDPMEARLQEILRFNMEKYCQQSLDTLCLARRVRELLSIHNIGQRLFAKYILGLSQGTVSELLSKPKCWDKLTEKGRDSYRKMHAWATDENAIYLLKSLIPKKGAKECGTPFRGPDETVTEERIQHILSEASRAMTSTSVPAQGGQQDQDSRSTDSKSPASSTHSPSSPLSRDARRIRKFDNDDMPQEKVAKIYQDELMKLMSRPQEPPLPLPRDPQYPGILFPFLGQTLLFNRSPEEVKMALDAYHQELGKLQSSATGVGLGAAGLALGGAGGLGVGVGGAVGMGIGLGAGGLHNGAQDLSLPKREQRSLDEDDDGRNLSAASPFCPTRSKAETSISTPTSLSSLSSSTPLSNLVTPITSIAVSSSSGEDLSVSASPLQRMASITNSLMTGPSIPTNAPVPQKPLKAILPPITQQQFDQYSNLNTEDIVKKVKEQLSQYSISQRLFGESVLGLSQGSVSDLLARPKPWHMLTQKGREPFIRMKIFLEDDNAVHKLVASQYKIAPEKLMRTGGYTAPPLYLVGGCPLPGGLGGPGARLPGMLSTSGSPTLPPYTSSGKPHPLKLAADLPKSIESPLPPVGIPPSLGGLPLSSHPMPFDTRMPPLDPLRKGPLSNPRHPGPVAPSVYEMAALTQDLDTQVITTKIKEVLLANNIGQKLFGEAVLGLSQGSVSELLSKPKPWHMLSIKGREPFIRMQLWLNDPRNLEKLQHMKNERREASKRRRALDPSAEVSQDSQDVFQAPSPGGTSKKQRVLFSEEQKEALKLAFALDPYPNLANIEFLAQELQLSTRTITNWFHNHRMRLKQYPGSPGGSSSPSREPPPPPPGQAQGQTFDPLNFRILLSQRILEVRKEKGLPPSLPGLAPGLPPSLFPHLPQLGPHALGGHNLDRDLGSGLDLSMKSENDFDDNSLDEDSNMSGAMSPGGGRSEGEGEDRDGRGAPSPVARSSRRKPAAPQWVNPSWASGDGPKEREVIINGVCVMQTDDYRPRDQQETVRIEPTPVEEARARSLKEEQEEEHEEDLQQPASSMPTPPPRPDPAEGESGPLQEEEAAAPQEGPAPGPEAPPAEEGEVEEEEEA